MLDESHGARDDGRRTSVVRHEVHAAKARQLGCQPKDPANVGEAPAIDRLIVIAHEEDAVGRRRKEESEAKLAAIDVLHLVDQELAARIPPAAERDGIAQEEVQGPTNQVVEIERAPVGERSFVVDERAAEWSLCRIGGDLRSGHAVLEFQGGEGGIQALSSRAIKVRPQGRDEAAPIDETVDVDTGIGEDLTPKGVERPHPHRSGGMTELLEGGPQTPVELLGRATIEGDRRDLGRIHRGWAGDEPGDPGHERRCLATSGRGDAEQGPRRGGRGGPLIVGKCGKAAGEGVRGSTGHPSMVRLGSHRSCIERPSRDHPVITRSSPGHHRSSPGSVRA